MKNKLLKGLTITLFSILILGFVAFRAGYFGSSESFYPFSPNGGALNNQKPKSREDSIRQIRMMSSSKTVIFSEKSLLLKDTSTVFVDSSQIKKVDSSKSKIVYPPKKENFDFLFSDSLKSK